MKIQSQSCEPQQGSPAAAASGVTSPEQVQHLEMHRKALADESGAQGAFFQVHGDSKHDSRQMVSEAWKKSCDPVPRLCPSFLTGGSSRAKLSGACGFALKTQQSSKAAQVQL